MHHDHLKHVEIGEAVACGRLVMAPLFWRGAPLPEESPWLAGCEALAGGLVAITEVSEGGAVRRLRLESRAERPVLLVDGETLEGAKQNRTLDLSILVPPGQAMPVPVSCVEEGRWTWRRRGFAPGRGMLFASARARKARRVSERMAVGAGAGLDHPHAGLADQGEVWDAVRSKLRRLGVDSRTSDLEAAYRSAPVREREAGCAERIAEARPGQVGAAFGLEGRWLGVELFGHPALYRAYRERVVRSWLLDERDPAVRPAGDAPETVEALVERLGRAPAAHRPAPGMGEHWRIEGPLAGSALLDGGRVVHLVAFHASEAA